MIHVQLEWLFAHQTSLSFYNPALEWPNFASFFAGELQICQAVLLFQTGRKSSSQWESLEVYEQCESLHRHSSPWPVICDSGAIESTFKREANVKQPSLTSPKTQGKETLDQGKERDTERKRAKETKRCEKYKWVWKYCGSRQGPSFSLYCANWK